MLKKEDAKDAGFLEKLDMLSDRTGKSRLELIHEANGYLTVKAGDGTAAFVASSEVLSRPPEVDTSEWGIPGLCGMNSVVRIFGDTEATEQALIQLCTGLAFGDTTFCSGKKTMRRRGLLIATRGSSIKIQRAVREMAGKLGIGEDRLICRDKDGNRILNRKAVEEDGMPINTIDYMEIHSFMEDRADGLGKTLWLEESWSDSGASAFRNGHQMLTDAVDDLVEAVKERHLGFIAFETPRPHFNRLEDALGFFTACRKLASRAGIDVIVRFIWDEHNRNVADRALYGSDEEQAAFSDGMRSYISTMEQQTRGVSMIEAHHDPRTGKISLNIVDSADVGKTAEIGYLEQKIQRDGKGADLSASTEFDV